jgi:homoserine kinase type II
VAVLTLVDKSELEQALSAYDVGAIERFSGVDRGTVNSSFELHAGGARWFFRLYEEQDRTGARAEARLLAHLREHGAKTPAPVARRDGELTGELRGKPCALFPFVPGDMLCQSAVTAPHAARLGAEIARLHAAAKGAEPRANRFGAAALAQRLDRVERHARPDLRALVPSLREKLERLTNARAAQELVVVHGDIFRDNVLFENGEVSSILDFESAGLETRTYDLAVAILAFAFRASFDWDLARAFVSGYDSVRPLGAAEKDALFADACLGALRFAITRITDCAMREESPKKDYRRFLARLDEIEALGAAAFQRRLA